MANTRFNNDPARIRKCLEESTFEGRWRINVPGYGTDMPFMEDPHIRLQKWGANNYTNRIDLEASLFNINRKVNRDHPAYNYKAYMPTNCSPLYYKNNNTLTTDQSRATHPAWMLREQEFKVRNDFGVKTFDDRRPPFEINVNTRREYLDTYVPNVKIA
jgi:hypothetical protein